MISLIITFLIIQLLKYVYSTGELVSPWTIFTALSIVDILMPAVLRIAFPEFNIYPIWMAKLEAEDLIIAVIFSFFGWVLFSLGYFNGKKVSIVKRYSIVFIPKRALLLLAFCLLFYAIYFIVIFNYHGGVDAYISNSLTNRFVSASDLPPIISFLNVIRPLVLTLIFIIVANLFYFYYKNGEGSVKIFFLPLLGFLMSLTTFFRGTILNYLFGFIALGNNKNNFDSLNSRSNNMKRKNNFKVVFFIVAAFLIVGAVRGFYIEKEAGNDTEISILKEVNKNLSGSALIGLASVIKNYGYSVDYLYGKTIFDMLLMPVPRVIYTSKPDWYGIDDITRGMGWPKSTQSAVSPQGEYYANFGVYGIILMYFLGALFGVCRKFAEKDLMHFSIYAFLILPVTLTTFWMSTTGLINGLKMIPFIFIILKILFRKNAGKV